MQEISKAGGNISRVHDGQFLCQGAQRFQRGGLQEKAWPKEELVN